MEQKQNRKNKWGGAMPLLFGTSKIDSAGILEIGGIKATELVEEFQTPLIVYDVQYIREQTQRFKQVFEQENFKYRINYASKAFSAIGIYQLLSELEISCDVVSGGELYTALQAGFPAERIEFHGNNKTAQELREAVAAKVDTIVLDNFDEITLLSNLLKKRKVRQKVQLRLAPGIEAHTHEAIMTGQIDSKFGFDIASGQAEAALRQVLTDESFELAGVHCHIGSQIFETASFGKAVWKMMEILHDWQEKYQFAAAILNIGGGFGVRYTGADNPPAPESFVKEILQEVKAACQKYAYPVPEVWIEPGRSLVAEAGTTLYTVGAQKELPGIRRYVSVDGGMGDNIRPALYQAEYLGFLANRDSGGDTLAEKVRLTGKYCESGDILIDELFLPKVAAGDVIAITSTGAYTYSMAMNYNRNPKSAVVFVENGEAQIVCRRETYADMMRLDIPLMRK